MPPITDVVKNLIIINVLIYFTVTLTPVGSIIPDLKLYFPLDTVNFKPYQLITHMFMHASPGHLFFNMLMLYFLGPYVEKYAGPKQFLILYLLSGVGAFLAHIGIQYYQYSSLGVNLFPPAVGASGAIMGVVIAFTALFPNVKLFLLFPPIPIKAKYLGIGYVLIDLFSGIGNFQPGVANFAHLGGALVGFLLTYFWIKRRKW
ncbi:MAG: rhomboid family intramembrane serine protease [Saprospiraceae bacterium]|nr:rhomboid family intramembrane serine protease [Saprospiraceae bacterium]